MHTLQTSTRLPAEQGTRTAPIAANRPTQTDVASIPSRYLAGMLFRFVCSTICTDPRTGPTSYSGGPATLKLFMLLPGASDAASSSKASSGTALYCATSAACCCFPLPASCRKRRHRLVARTHQGACMCSCEAILVEHEQQRGAQNSRFSSTGTLAHHASSCVRIATVQRPVGLNEGQPG
jgi:hypothetical protein